MAAYFNTNAAAVALLFLLLLYNTYSQASDLIKNVEKLVFSLEFFLFFHKVKLLTNLSWWYGLTSSLLGDCNTSRLC